ncbi:MAG: penicillin-binding protein activator LpoB [Proteobacteria bacterium]|nr:penicillin-binding protein activator LpoB [Pseudomonadota bacterium]
MNIIQHIVAGLFVLLLCSCAATQGDNAGGHAVVYEDPSARGEVSGIGIDSNDIVAMTGTMVSSMLQNPLLMGRKPAPRIIIDAEHFKNESSTRINKNMITDRLRIELNRAANGRILFLSREYSDVVDKERTDKREGNLTKGSMGMAKAQAGADFRLVGRISSKDALRHKTGQTSRFHQITFEMIDLETSAVIWGDQFEFKKTGQDDVVYR